MRRGPGNTNHNTNSWWDLESALDGSFLVRARGLLGTGFVLSGKSGEFGSLSLGAGGAEFEADGLTATIERAGTGHRMLTGGEETLTANRRSSGGLWILAPNGTPGGHSYEASLRLLRNTATARSRGGEEVVRVRGGLASRGYEASFADGALPVAVFLLYYAASLRRRAFRASAAVR